ncbi:MAG: TonB-dependent receptor [Acidobacteria bacterium]|nr:TonB-dependent receptor [Acidobacteriota bacterium]
MNKILSVAALSLALAGQGFLASPAMHGQAISVNGGAITGTVTDNTGAVVPNASVKVTSPDTGYTNTVTSNSAGVYQIGPLNPGKYNLVVTAPGFSTVNVATVVRTGTATSGDVKLNIGSTADTIEVSTGDLQINTEQAGVSDVITQEQINKLPVNGRNFLDVAQIEPGVILQSGETFDPTKAGYSALSISGVSGRTTRIMLDGQDITDENVGTTMFNLPTGAVNEFQLNRSTQDVSGEVTSTGAVLVSTRTGTNSYHGQLFYNFEDYRSLFANQRGTKVPFQRNQYGGNIGGPIFKDKLFFFVDAERIQQKSSSSSVVSVSILPQIRNAFPAVGTPYKETYSTARLDWNGPLGGHYFARGNYNVNSVASNYGYGYWLYASRNNTYGFAFGADFTSGRLTHSFRGSYEKFHNLISDATSGNASVYNGIPGFAFYRSALGLFSGPNYLAPQETYQSDKQLRYDGSWTKGAHNIRFGANLNRVLGGGYASFFGLAPRASIAPFTGPTATDPMALGCDAIAGAAACASDPLRGYYVSGMYIGNGQGGYTERPGFGSNQGGSTSWRYAFYAQDTWKVTPNTTFTLGMRYEVDTNRANQDLDTPTCADVDPSILPAGCSSGSVKLFDLYSPGLGRKIKQPYNNFAPQAGLVYSPGSHKTSIRAAFGMFIETNVFNNQSNARTGLLKTGLFNDTRTVCGGNTSVDFPSGKTVSDVDGKQIGDLCTATPVGVSSASFIKLQQAYQADTRATGAQANGAYVGNTLNADGLYAPDYRQPYSMQWNFGIQRELAKGIIISADYVHNSMLHFIQQIDVNRNGAARYLNTTAATNAISKTNGSYAGCGATATAASTNCAIAAGARIANYAKNGLDSDRSRFSGYPSTAYGIAPNSGAAFPGINNTLGNGGFLFPGGRSGFDALQLVFREQKAHPLPGIVSSNLQIAYQFGRSETTSGTTGGAGSSDQFFSALTWNNDNPTADIGPSSIDRRHQLNMGGSFTVKHGPTVGLVGHFYSALPTSLVLDTTQSGGQIFQTDINGDGLTGDLAPGTRPGAYMRDIRGGDVNKYINNYNAKYAGSITPAGQALVTAGLLTPAQLVAMNAAVRPLATSPSNKSIENPTFRSFDVGFSYPIRFNRVREGLSLEPGIVFYNVFNFSNFGRPSGTLLNTTTVGGPSGTTAAANGYLSGVNNFLNHETNRSQRQSGTYSQGAPRQTEFQLKLNF